MKLPEIASYSQQQLLEVQNFSSSFRHYYELILRKPAGLAESLRLQRHTAWLECVLAEFHQTATSRDICLHWSLTADQILQQACQFLAGELKVDLALFAYGKLGAQELNLSSDIDLVFVSQEDQPLNSAFLRKFQALIQELSEWGFCFRTDFDLRPGGRMGPLVPSFDQFQDYYGNYGEAWERLAFVRLRPIWGNAEIIEQTLKFIEKFTFRKHLDYSLLSDLKSLRQRIHSQYFHRSTEDQIDLKLGVGGIRDLELFVHALQVVHGGRDLDLREKGTFEALQALSQKKILPEQETTFLEQHYWLLRRWENLVQAECDQQTHLLRFDFQLNPPHVLIQDQMQQCDHLVSDLLGKVDLKTKSIPATDQEQLQWLAGLGFDIQEVSQVWAEMISTTVLSRQKERDEGYRLRFLFLFIEELARFPKHRTRSLYLLKDFLKSIRAKATFYSLFLNQEQLIGQMARIFSTSPYLASLFISRPELTDSYFYKTQSSLASDDPQILLDLLSERKLLSELVNGTDFLSTLNLSGLTSRMTETADQIATVLLKSVESETNCKLDILALGKWGGRELGLRSDLDFIFVTNEEPDETHMKAARRFFHRLTESHHRGGSLYSIDLRLRPSGNAGLMVSSYSQLLDYLNHHAQAWERQAYLRTRFFDSAFDSGPIIQSALSRQIDESDLRHLNEIRIGLLKNESKDSNEIDLKYAEGALVDLEFAIQISLLKNQVRAPQNTLEQMKQMGWLEVASLYEFMRVVEQTYQGVALTSGAILQTNSDAFESMAALLKETRDGLEKRLRSALKDSQHLLKRLDPRRAHA